MTVSTPVVVLACGSGWEGVLSGYGGLGVARTLGRVGVPMYLVCDHGLFPLSFSRYWKRTFRWHLSAPSAESVKFLLDVGRAAGTRPLLLSTTDISAAFVSDHAEALARAFTFPRVPAGLLRSLANKVEMTRAAKAQGIAAPEIVVPSSRDDVVRFLDTARFPIVLKGIDPLRSHGHTKQIVSTAGELLERYDSVAGSPNLMLQEYIPGDDMALWMCMAYFNDRSECLAAFTGRKMRQYPPHAGIATLSVCEPNATVEGATKAFMKAVGYRGLVAIGYRYDARDGRYKVLDLNPRVDGAFRLCVTPEGVDVVRVCYLDQTRQAIPPFTPPVGRKWMVEEDLFSAVGYARGGTLSFRQWVASLRGIEETQWFAADDVVPFLVWCRMRFPYAARALPRLAVTWRRPTSAQRGRAYDAAPGRPGLT